MFCATTQLLIVTVQINHVRHLFPTNRPSQNKYLHWKQSHIFSTKPETVSTYLMTIFKINKLVCSILANSKLASSLHKTSYHSKPIILDIILIIPLPTFLGQVMGGDPRPGHPVPTHQGTRLPPNRPGVSVPPGEEGQRPAGGGAMSR